MDIFEYKALLKQRDEINAKIEEIESEYSNATLYHFDIYVVDVYHLYKDAGGILYAMEGRNDFHIHTAKSESRDILWHDDIDINQGDCPIEAFADYFRDKEANSWPE